VHQGSDKDDVRKLIDVIDATQNAMLQEWPSKRKAIVQEVSKNGGLHPIYIEDNRVNVIRQLTNSTSETPTLKVTGQLRSALNITKTPDESEALFFACNIVMTERYSTRLNVLAMQVHKIVRGIAVIGATLL
jgi:hypothetical protein